MPEERQTSMERGEVRWGGVLVKSKVLKLAWGGEGGGSDPRGVISEEGLVRRD